MSPELRNAGISKSWVDKEVVLLETPEETQPCPHLGFNFPNIPVSFPTVNLY